jgi:glyoxylase-like metal-dependent hydrolase (beta-lactamase superfamily II)
MMAAHFVAAIRGALTTLDPPTITIGTRKGRFPAVVHPLILERQHGRDAIPEGTRVAAARARDFSAFLARIAAGELLERRAFRRALDGLPKARRGAMSGLFDALYAALQFAAWEQETGEAFFGATSSETVLTIVAGQGRLGDPRGGGDAATHVSHFLVHAAVVLGASEGMSLDALVSEVDRRLAAWGEDPAHPAVVAHAAYNLFVAVTGTTGDDRDYDLIRDGRSLLGRGADPLTVYRGWWDVVGWHCADQLVRILAPDHRRAFFEATRAAVDSGTHGEPAVAARRLGFVNERGAPHVHGRRLRDDVVLQFPGGSAIGRSCTMVEGGGRRILVDFGSDQFGRHPNWSPELHDLDGLFITHAHHDHIGGLFHLYEDLGYQGDWFADPITIACTRLALEDARRLQEGGERLSAAGKALVSRVMDGAVPLRDGETATLGEVTVTGHAAGHVMGSLQFLVQSSAPGRPRSVMVSGDVNPVASLSVPPLTWPSAVRREQVDALVVEGTNALRPDDPVIAGESARMALWAALDAQPRHPILLPVMSLGRAQEVIAALGGTRWRVGVFGLAAKMTAAMAMPVPPNVSLVTSQWRDTARGDFDVLVASAGSLQGGPARFFHAESGWNPPVVFTGYLFPGTPAHALAESCARVRFSGHASADAWQGYCDAFPNASRFLVHYPGPPAPAEAMGFVIPRADRSYVVGMGAGSNRTS